MNLVAIKAAEVHAAINVLDLRMRIGMSGSDLLTMLQSGRTTCTALARLTLQQRGPAMHGAL